VSDYLWDKTGEPDPDVRRLEDLLGEFRHRGAAPATPAQVLPIRPPIRWLAIAAMLTVIAGATWLITQATTTGWTVARLEGAPKVGAIALRGVGRLPIGASLETDSVSRAELSVGRIGVVRVEPNTRLLLLESRLREHRLQMDRGKIEARIWAPPRLFYVNMPSAVAIDLGCAYTLEVDDSGAGRIHVTIGWVAFDAGGVESFIPAGAACRTRREQGPGVPYYLDASERFIAAVEAGDLPVILAEARPRDAITLWHLLGRVPEYDRPAVYDRLAAIAPPPAHVTREGVLRGNREMLDAWWTSFGLYPANWWRLWKGPWPH
jgi:hypothetical protein